MLTALLILVLILLVLSFGAFRAILADTQETINRLSKLYDVVVGYGSNATQPILDELEKLNNRIDFLERR